jgi:hypothetical protein
MRTTSLQDRGSGPPTTTVVLRAAGCRTAARMKRATSSSATKEWRREASPTSETGCSAASGPSTRVGNQVSMKMFGQMIVCSSPLERRYASVSPFARRNGTGLSGSAPSADTNTNRATEASRAASISARLPARSTASSASSLPLFAELAVVTTTSTPSQATASVSGSRQVAEHHLGARIRERDRAPIPAAPAPARPRPPAADPSRPDHPANRYRPPQESCEPLFSELDHGAPPR